jgi:hypothetical protein
LHEDIRSLIVLPDAAGCHSVRAAIPGTANVARSCTTQPSPPHPVKTVKPIAEKSCYLTDPPVAARRMS